MTAALDPTPEVSMSRNAGAAIPAAPQVRFYDVISPRREFPVDAVLLSDTFFGKWVHWVEIHPGKGVTVSCDESESCPRCKQRMPHRWNGYIAAMMSQTRDFFVLCLTEGVARQLLNHLTEYGSLRGLQFVFTRGRDKVNAKVTASFVGQCRKEVVPEEFPIMSSLSRLWGINEEAIRNGGRMTSAPLPSAGNGSRLPPPPRETYTPLPGPDGERPKGGDGAEAKTPRRLTAEELKANLRRLKGDQT